MRLLLDTHILLGLIGKRTDAFAPEIKRLLDEPTLTFCVSVASLWEIAIKSRLGKLRIAPSLESLPGLIARLGIDIIPLNEKHALIGVDPEPPTRDPFDRMLLAQCQTEDLRLVTIDKALVKHPLAAKPI